MRLNVLCGGFKLTPPPRRVKLLTFEAQHACHVLQAGLCTACAFLVAARQAAPKARGGPVENRPHPERPSPMCPRLDEPQAATTEFAPPRALRPEAQTKRMSRNAPGREALGAAFVSMLGRAPSVRRLEPLP